MFDPDSNRHIDPDPEFVSVPSRQWFSSAWTLYVFGSYVYMH